MSDKYQALSEKNKSTEEEIGQLTESINALQNDNDFMKKLIFHAN